MSELILYTTLGCHLCEQAKAQIYPALEGKNITLKEVDIADSDELMVRYGVRIPVIHYLGGELGWPFSSADVAQLLAEHDL